MAYYKNPITRYLLRKNVLNRIKGRLRLYKRLLTKDALSDIAFLEQGRGINTIIDAGANVGFMTYQLQKRFPDAQIYAFEPNPYVFKQLIDNNSNEENIHPLQLGIADVKGELTFHINANTGTSSFLPPGEYHRTHQAKHPKESKIVPVCTLDDFCQSRGINHIDILKLDIEGFELKALIGANQLITDQEIDIIYTEVNVVPSYDGQPLFHDITSYLETKNYYIYNIDTFVGQETPINQAILGNATYISAKFRLVLEDKFGKQNCGW